MLTFVRFRLQSINKGDAMFLTDSFTKDNK